MTSGDSVTDLIGRTFDGRYRIERLLGKGGMGAVYLASQVAMDKAVALKVLARHLSDDENQVKRFEVEAHASSKLKHPNTIRVFDFGRSSDGHLYIAMEYLEGNELSRVIKAGGPMDPMRVCHIARQVVKSVGEAHAKGLVHRDLKPDNIFLCDFFGEEDFVKVLDFGIAKFAEGPDEGSLTQTGFICGTPLYIAPEQAMGTRITPRTDLYSLGILMFEMLAGRPPFKAETPIAIVMKQIHDAPPRINALNPNAQVPPALERLIIQMMAKDPEKRPADADAVSSILGSILAQGAAGVGQSTGDRFTSIGQEPGEEPTLVSGSPGAPDPFEAIPTAAIPSPAAALAASEAIFRADSAAGAPRPPLPHARGGGPAGGPPPPGPRLLGPPAGPGAPPGPRTASGLRKRTGSAPLPQSLTGAGPAALPFGAGAASARSVGGSPPGPPPLPAGAGVPREGKAIAVPPPIPKEAMGPPTAPGSLPVSGHRPSGPPTRDTSTGAIPNPSPPMGSADVPLPMLILAALVALSLAGGAVWHFALGGAGGAEGVQQVKADAVDPVAVGHASLEGSSVEAQAGEDVPADEPTSGVLLAGAVPATADRPGDGGAAGQHQPGLADTTEGGAGADSAPPTWSVELRTDPSDAEVLIGEEVLGKTPFVVGIAPGSRLALELRLAGYVQVPVTLAPEDEEAASAGLDVVLAKAEEAKEPAAKEPAAKEPAAKEPAAKEPAAKEPATKEPAAKEPAAKEPAADKPAADKPAADKPAAGKPAADKPAAQEPATNKPASKAPASKTPAKAKPTSTPPSQPAKKKKESIKWEDF